MTACIVGWAHTAFGRLEGETVESLVTRVTRDALADAGIEPRDVGEIVLGTPGSPGTTLPSGEFGNLTDCTPGSGVVRRP